MKLDVSDFNTWLAHPVTARLRENASQLKKNLEDQMANPDVIMGEQCQTKLAWALGYKTSLEDFLSQTIDDINNFNTEEDVE